MHSKVEFIEDNGQKIVLDFVSSEDGTVSFTPRFEPQITDPKTDLGLSGNLCELFVTAIKKMSDEDHDNTKSSN